MKTRCWVWAVACFCAACGAAPSAEPVAPSTPAAVAAGAAPEASGGDSPRATIERAIALMEARRYEELIRTLFDPEDVAAFTTPVADVAQHFADNGRDARFLRLLTTFRADTPRLDPKTHTASYWSDDGLRLRLHELHGRWYLKN